MAAVIVIAIVLLALRIAKQAKTAVGAVEVVRQQTAELGGIAPDQRLGREDPARRPVAPEGGGREVIVALTSNGYWAVALGLGAAAAVVVAILLLVLVLTVGSIEKSVDGLLEIAGKVAANTANIPQLEATAPVLALDRGRSDRPGRLHERAHRRVRSGMSDTHLLALLTRRAGRPSSCSCSPSR